MDGLKEQILRVVRLEDVVARYLPLGRSGGHTLVGLCPFHADRHPSLRVRTDKQYYKCFACGEGGDVFRFVQQVEGVSFREALLRIAGWYGLYASDGVFSLPPVRCRQVPPEGAVLVASRAAILSLLRQHQFILGCLTPYVPTEPVLAAAYLAFEVGIAPSSLPASYVSLCGRLVFPIRNEAGTLVAFAGRYVGVADGKTAKYVNSPTSPVYHKDRLLYGLSLAEASIRRHGFVYVTEGYKDVLAMHAVGFEQTVALCGTALTAHHAELLRRYTHRVVLLLDGDRAGLVASVRAEEVLRGAGFAVSRLVLSPGEDPDSLLRQCGQELFRAMICRLTCLCRLETYEAELVEQLKTLYANLSVALTAEERRPLLGCLMPLRRRLAKVTTRLGRNVVVKGYESEQGG